MSAAEFLLLPGFWLFGLLLGLTPCTIPAILIMSSICNTENHTKKVTLVLTWVTSIAAAYAIVGIIIAILGQYFSTIIALPAVSACASILFAILGFATLGLFNLTLFPHHWLNFIHQFQSSRKYNPYIEAIMIGSTATLLASACVIAPLAALLWYVLENPSTLSSGIILFTVGIGFGTPMLGIAIFGSELLQRAGKWQKFIKQLFGLALLGFAINLSSKIVSPSLSMLLWSFLLIFSGIYMGAFVPEQRNPLMEDMNEQCRLDGESAVIRKFHLMHQLKMVMKMASVLVLLYGILIFMGFLLGNTNPLSPLA